jgi:hypothetical protein
MQRSFTIWALVLLVVACAEAVTPDPSAGGNPTVDLEPTDIPHVSWSELESLILDGKAVMVAATHSNWAIVTLRNGQTVTSKQPERGAVFHVVARCGAPCAGIGIAIE